MKAPYPSTQDPALNLALWLDVYKPVLKMS
jgi:hypothetical protein